MFVKFGKWKYKFCIEIPDNFGKKQNAHILLAVKCDKL